MKKAIFKKIFAGFIVLALFSLSFSVSAWRPDHGFWCSISAENIPADTYYIDFLLPIHQKDKAYIEFNQSNGEKFGIEKSSEIVKYCEDGFVSYTFHVVDADSQMIPYYACCFEVVPKVYEENKELFSLFDTDCDIDENTGYRYYSTEVQINTAQDKAIKMIEDLTVVKISENQYSYLYTLYNSEYGRESQFDYDYCCRNYKYAKMAYLDKEGNILSVSSAAKIPKSGLVSYNLNLYLEGNEFTSSPESGPPFWILGLIIYSIPILVVIAFIILIIVIKKRKKKI